MTLFPRRRESTVGEIANTLRWGLDNKFYGSASYAGGNIRWLATPAAPPVSLSRRDWSFDPKTGVLGAVTGSGEVSDRFAGLALEYEGADGHSQDHVRAGLSGAVRTFAVAAAVGLEFAVVAIAQECVVVRIGFEVDAAAAAAVAAGWAAAWNVFFAAERDAAVTTVAGLHEYFGFVNKHGE